MISPHTAPGTKVICIDDSFGIQKASVLLHGLAVGEVYTVAEIVPSTRAHAGFCAVLNEIVRPDDGTPEGRGFSLSRFRLLELPKSITDCLTSQPLLRQKELTGSAIYAGHVRPSRSLVAGAATIQNFTSFTASSPTDMGSLSRFPACAGEDASRSNFTASLAGVRYSPLTGASFRGSFDCVPPWRVPSLDLARGVSAPRVLSGA